jgi:acetyl-CoA C-acetyltransferase
MSVARGGEVSEARGGAVGRREDGLSRVWIAGGARTPLGGWDGGLKDYKEQGLAAAAMSLTLERAGAAAGDLSEIIVGAAKQTSLPSNLARYAMLEAGFPDTVPAYTAQRQSASGLQAIVNGLWAIKSGLADLILAGGSESMSRMPGEIHQARYAFGPASRLIFDPIAAQVAGAQPEALYGRLTLEDVNSRLAEAGGITAGEMERFAADSGRKAASRTERPWICKLKTRRGKAVTTLAADEVYSAPSLVARPADGAAMVLLASGERAKRLSPLGEILAVGIGAGSPAGEGYAPAGAISGALGKAGLTQADMALIDIGEMTAAQALVTLKALGVSPADSRVNIAGGGLAVGNPWGASGPAQLVDMIYALDGRGHGMIVTPAEGGQAICLIIRAGV